MNLIVPNVSNDVLSSIARRNDVTDGDIDVAATEFHRRFHISSDETEGQDNQVSTHTTLTSANQKYAPHVLSTVGPTLLRCWPCRR